MRRDMSKRASRYRKDARGNPESGLGVIEVSIVLVISAILISVSAMYFTKTRYRYKLSQNAQSVVWQIERARTLAIKYNQTLTMGFTTSNTVLTLTCSDCASAKMELPAYSLPSGMTLSTYPTITIKGNGTISSSAATITASDGQGRSVVITISNSGRTTVGTVTES